MPDHAVVSDFCALRISLTVFSALSGTRLLACLIVAPQRGYDEPGILSYAISSFCPTSADGLQSPTLIGSAPWLAMTLVRWIKPSVGSAFERSSSRPDGERDRRAL